jgi:hypothetical protein
MFGSPGFLDQQSKDLGLAAQVKPIGQAYQSFVNSNPVGVESAYEAQKKSMIEAIGAPMMQAAIPVMKSITELFGKIGSFANANPAAITTIAQVAGALATASVVLGGVAVGAGIVALLPGGAITAGIVALGAAAAGLYVAFSKVDPSIGAIAKTVVTSIDGAMNQFGHRLTDGLEVSREQLQSNLRLARRKNHCGMEQSCRFDSDNREQLKNRRRCAATLRSGEPSHVDSAHEGTAY